MYGKVLIVRVLIETEEKICDIQLEFRNGKGCKNNFFKEHSRKVVGKKQNVTALSLASKNVMIIRNNGNKE